MARKTTLTGVPLASLLPSWELTLQKGNKSPKTILSYLGTAARLVAYLKDHGMPDDTEQVDAPHLRAFLLAEAERTSPVSAGLLERQGLWFGVIDEALPASPASLRDNWSAVGTFRAALHAVAHAESLEDGLHLAVSIGGDTDTVAAIAGALLGAVYGASAVPQEYREILHGWPSGNWSWGVPCVPFPSGRITSAEMPEKGARFGKMKRRFSQVVGAAALAVAAVAVPAGAASAASPPAAGDQWPMFGRGPQHWGVSSDTAIGASSAPGLAVRWSRALNTTKDQPSPAVAWNSSRGTLVVYDVTHTGVVSAFNALTGALLWHRSTPSGVFSSPAIYGNTVYFGNNSGQLEELNAATGAVQCVFTMPGAAGRIFSAPAAVSVSALGGPVAFFGDAGPGGTNESDNGGHLWAVTGLGNTAGGCKELWAYSNWPNKGNGTQTGVWDEPGFSHEADGTPVVVFGTSNPDNSVYALNAVTGARLWRFATAQNGPDEDVGAGPTISQPGHNGFADGVAYIDGKDGIEYALDLATGTPVWTYTLGAGSGSALAVATAALAGSTLVTAYGGTLFALNAVTGALDWQASPGGTVQASPAVSGASGDQVLFAGDTSGTEYGFRLADGARLFAASPGTAAIQDSTAISDGLMFFAGNGTLYAYGP